MAGESSQENGNNPDQYVNPILKQKSSTKQVKRNPFMFNVFVLENVLKRSRAVINARNDVLELRK